MEGSECGYRTPGSLGTDMFPTVTSPGPYPGVTLLQFSCRCRYPCVRGTWDLLVLRIAWNV